MRSRQLMMMNSNLIRQNVAWMIHKPNVTWTIFLAHYPKFQSLVMARVGCQFDALQVAREFTKKSWKIQAMLSCKYLLLYIAHIRLPIPATAQAQLDDISKCVIDWLIVIFFSFDYLLQEKRATRFTWIDRVGDICWYVSATSIVSILLFKLFLLQKEKKYMHDENQRWK